MPAIPWGYSVKNQLFDAEKQLAACLCGVQLSLEGVPDDYIPKAFVNVGCNAIPSAFGCELSYGEHPDQTPALKAPILHSPSDVFTLE